MTLRRLLVANGLIVLLLLFGNIGKKPMVAKPVSQQKNKLGKPGQSQITPISPKTVPAPPEPAPTVSVEWLERESESMNQLDADPTATVARLKKTARAMTPEQRRLLLDTAMNSEAGQNERALAVYMLTLDPRTPSEAFETIAMMPNPYAQQELDAHSAEVHDVNLTKALAAQATMELKRRAQ